MALSSRRTAGTGAVGGTTSDTNSSTGTESNKKTLTTSNTKKLKSFYDIDIQANTNTNTNTPNDLEMTSTQSPVDTVAKATSKHVTVDQLSPDDRYRYDRQLAKERHWKSSEFAVGLVEISFDDEMLARRDPRNLSHASSACGGCCDCCNPDVEPGCGCGCGTLLSGYVCRIFGGRRLGNMLVLKETVVEVSRDENDLEEQVPLSSEPSPSRTRTTRIDYIVGPFWPMYLFVTWPLVVTVSGMTLLSAIPHKHPIVIGAWFAATSLLFWSLFNVGCRDPGILRRRSKAPPDERDRLWRWNDRALTYRPRRAIYDTDCACIIEDFDHTCPWTGTAIGKNNMLYFQVFVSHVFICLIVDILLLTNAV